MRRAGLLVWFATLLVVAGNLSAQPVKLAPVDEAAGDPTWTHFRARLIDALVKHDRKFVTDIVDRNVRNISGSDGIVEFRKLWEPKSMESPLWSELPKVMFLGSVMVRQGKTTEVCAPYVYFKWPANAPDNANAAIVTREALLKSRPSAQALTLQSYSYDLVAVSDWEIADESRDSRQIWIAIKTAAGTGYLPQEQARSPLEYRACFVKQGTTWRMTGLEVGE